MMDVLTSSEAARLCGVSFRTIIRWIERGQLQAYKLPGRGDHRITVTALRRFMRANAIPEPPEMARETSHRILVVEDDANMARAIQRVLRHDGYETAIAADGFQAGLLLHTFQPGLMTLDLRMPALGGLEVLRVLRETPLPFNCKVLIISGETPARLQEALAHGADGVLTKPFANRDLLAAVRRLYGEEREEPR